MKKKNIAMLLVLTLLLFSFTGCGSKTSSDESVPDCCTSDTSSTKSAASSANSTKKNSSADDKENS